MSEIIHSDSAPGIDVNLGPQIVVATWVLTSLSALFLLMRVFGKLWTARKLLVDDYVLVTAWLAVLAPAVISTIAVGQGLGRHVSTVPEERIPELAVLINITVSILIFAAALSKTSFAITVLRLVNGYLRILIWFIIISTNVFLGTNIVFLWINFEIGPRGTSFPTISSALNDGLSIFGMATTAYSATMDFALVGVAWYVVSGLHMRSWREKIGLGLAMSMGAAAGATSIVKAAVLPSLSGSDFTFTSPSLHVWSLAEPAVTIMAASMPLLRVLCLRVTQARTRPSAAIRQAETRAQAPRPALRRETASTAKSTASIEKIPCYEKDVAHSFREPRPVTAPPPVIVAAEHRYKPRSRPLVRREAGPSRSVGSATGLMADHEQEIGYTWLSDEDPSEVDAESLREWVDTLLPRGRMRSGVSSFYSWPGPYDMDVNQYAQVQSCRRARTPFEQIPEGMI